MKHIDTLYFLKPIFSHLLFIIFLPLIFCFMKVCMVMLNTCIPAYWSQSLNLPNFKSSICVCHKSFSFYRLLSKLGAFNHHKSNSKILIANDSKLWMSHYQCLQNVQF